MTESSQTATSRPTPTEPEPTTLYRFFDANDQLLYIGITSSIITRWAGHSRTKRDWRRAVRATLEHFDTREDALAAETAAIQAEKPAWNIRHNRNGRQLDHRARQAAEQRLTAGHWLSESELGDLFYASPTAVNSWLRTGPPLTKKPIGFRRSASGEREVNPEDVAELLLETRKIRDCDHPDGIPGQFFEPPPV